MELEIQDISKSLDRIYTLDKVSIQVKDQEFVAVLGPSGCGKSTLLNIVSGLIPPDQGRILIGGEDWTGRTGRVSYMQQNDLLLPSRNILDNVIVPLLLKGIKRNDLYRYLHQNNIGANVHYIPIYKFTYYQKRFQIDSRTFPATEDVFDRIITLPLHPAMTEGDLEYISETLKKAGSGL